MPRRRCATTRSPRQATKALYNFSKPTIAKITGYCIGGGMNLAACCDMRFCNEGARFGVPAAKLGLGYGFLRIERLSRIVGLPRAMEFLFTARQYSSKEAYEMGLVNGVAADAELDALVARTYRRDRARTRRSPSRSPRPPRARSPSPNRKQDHAKLEKMAEACFDSEDFKEGRRAFMEKRKPVSRGTSTNANDRPAALAYHRPRPHGASRRPDRGAPARRLGRAR